MYRKTCDSANALQEAEDLHHFEARDFCQFPWNWTRQMVVIKSPRKTGKVKKKWLAV